jgi:predicted restriction endonuclease
MAAEHGCPDRQEHGDGRSSEHEIAGENRQASDRRLRQSRSAHQFADSRNNDVRNGIALCKNAHWLFDNGLWAIRDNYTVKVAAGFFSEESPHQKPLSEYEGEPILLPSNPALYPGQEHLEWHRKKKFVGRA